MKESRIQTIYLRLIKTWVTLLRQSTTLRRYQDRDLLKFKTVATSLEVNYKLHSIARYAFQLARENLAHKLFIEFPAGFF